jgi:hypothetical protein
MIKQNAPELSQGPFSGGKTKFPLTILKYSCQGFFPLKSLALTKISVNYITQFLRVSGLPIVLQFCRFRKRLILRPVVLPLNVAGMMVSPNPGLFDPATSDIKGIDE